MSNSPTSVLPPELLILIFAHLPLKSLIAARTVAHQWRSLVFHAPLPTARRKLLEFYYTTIEAPHFLSTRQANNASLIPSFDREAYVNKLEERIRHVLPEEFLTWVLEWPAKAIVKGIWPGKEIPKPIRNGWYYLALQWHSSNENNERTVQDDLPMQYYPSPIPFPPEINSNADSQHLKGLSIAKTRRGLDWVRYVLCVGGGRFDGWIIRDVTTADDVIYQEVGYRSWVDFLKSDWREE